LGDDQVLPPDHDEDAVPRGLHEPLRVQDLARYSDLVQDRDDPYEEEE
jgi:hypothetical protein